MLDGVKIEGVPHLEDLTPEHMALVLIRVQQMRRAKIEDIEDLSDKVAKAVKKATKTRARKFLNNRGARRTTARRRRSSPPPTTCSTPKRSRPNWKRPGKYLKLLKDDWDTCRSINTNQRAQRSATEGYGG